ncbi:Cellulase (Glycosyl hydrolase family 5) [Chelatococcus asaccharovorans]|nr:Cellulase (Glycosyl hydrolase family 5) [Chelatococcus asaccharovorans]CAH1683253.1 Cellulase (Glycosyl hydrolase family 5) [Chelatococcus asaccharovorans]
MSFHGMAVRTGDSMGRLLRSVLTGVTLVTLAAAQSPAPAGASADPAPAGSAPVGSAPMDALRADDAVPAFRRGTNVTWFAFPATDVRAGRTVYASAPYAAPDITEPARLKTLGFDHVRLPMDFGPLLENDRHGRDKLLDDVEQAVRRYRTEGLGVIITLMAPGLNGALPDAFLDGVHGPQFRRYRALARHIARRLDGLPAGPPVALELMNEPQQACRAQTRTDWTVHQRALVETLRKDGRTLPLLLTGGCWSTIEGLVRLDGSLFRDRRNLVSAHFYDPFVFTHQGSTWTLPFLAEVRGVPYPAASGRVEDTLARTEAAFAATSRWQPAERDRQHAAAEKAIRWYFTAATDRATIDKAFDRLKAWQTRNDIRPAQIVFTEFGAMRPEGATAGDDASRARWLRDVATAIADNGWGWTLWLLSTPPFGLEDMERADCPAAALIQAIGLALPASCQPVSKR